MAGLLGGGGQDPGQASGPQSPGILTRMQAQYAPGAYEAAQRAQQQQAVYQAAMQTQGMSPQIAQALAMSPQFFGAQQGSYLPQTPQVIPVQQNDGSQTLMVTSNKGGAAGHVPSVSGMNITEPPGTTPAPAGAAGAQGAAPAGDQPAPVAGPKTTLEGMPGSTQAMMKQIDANKAAGADPTAGIPQQFKVMAQAVLDGRETLKDITSQRGAQTRNVVNAIALTMDPEFDENMNEARNTYRKQFSSGKATDIGGQVKSINKLAGHANEVADSATAMHNYGMGGAGAFARPVNYIGNMFNSTPQAGLKRAADLYNNELSTYVSGKGGSGVEERKQRSEAFDPNATPQEMGNTLLTDISFIKKQIEGNEQQRNGLFKNPKMQQQFQLASPEAMQQLHEAEIKAHKLIGDYDQWSKTTEGQGGGGGLPPGWKVVK